MTRHVRVELAELRRDLRERDPHGIHPGEHTRRSHRHAGGHCRPAFGRRTLAGPHARLPPMSPTLRRTPRGVGSIAVAVVLVVTACGNTPTVTRTLVMLMTTRPPPSAPASVGPF